MTLPYIPQTSRNNLGNGERVGLANYYRSIDVDRRRESSEL